MENGAQSVIKLKELDKLPDGKGEQFSKLTGIRNTPDALVDRLPVEMKTITSANDINNRTRLAKNQAGTVIIDARPLGDTEAAIMKDMRRAIGNSGADLDRIVVITINKTLLWERGQ